MAAKRTVPVTIGGETFTADVMRVGLIRQLEAPLREMGALGKGEMPTSSQILAMMTIAHAAIAPNHHGMTLDTFTAMVDALDWIAGMRELTEAVTFILGRSLPTGVTGDPSAGEAGSPAS